MITIVTGNAHKLAEFKRLLPSDFPYTSQKVELEELQTFDLNELIEDKARRAFAVVGGPVIVEDVSAGLVAFNGLPGPFIKFYEQQLGIDALYKISKDDKRAVVTCTMCYFDGERTIVVNGITNGIVAPMVEAPKMFGFDSVFIPDGQTLRYAEMTPEQKDLLSHRGKAVRALLDQLQQ